MDDIRGETPLVEAARRLGISWERAWRLAITGVLVARKVGRSWMVSQASVEKLVRERAEQSGHRPEITSEDSCS